MPGEIHGDAHTCLVTAGNGRPMEQHEQRWLVRRAARLEAGTASGAAAWQQHCQNWLHVRNAAFLARETIAGTAHGKTLPCGEYLSIGYQHSVIATYAELFSGSNRDGLEASRTPF